MLLAEDTIPIQPSGATPNGRDGTGKAVLTPLLRLPAVPAQPVKVSAPRVVVSFVHPPSCCGIVVLR